MTKLINNESLPHANVYCRVGRSKVAGVGLFAVIPIRKGTVIFAGNEPPTQEISVANVANLSPGIRRLYEDFAVKSDGVYICPADLSELTVGWFFNHSKHPNVDCRVFRSRTDGFEFVAARNIKVDEELFLDYDNYERLYLLLHNRQADGSHKTDKTKG